MIHTVDMQPKCFNIMSHMFLQPIKRRGQEVQSGSVRYEHLEGERELLYKYREDGCWTGHEGKGNSTGS